MQLGTRLLRMLYFSRALTTTLYGLMDLQSTVMSMQVVLGASAHCRSHMQCRSRKGQLD